MGKKLPEQTKKEVKKARKAMKEGKADNIDRLLVIMSDGKWHDGAEFANKVTWRFSGTLHDLKKRHGVEWEKERIEGSTSGWCYRLLKEEA